MPKLNLGSHGNNMPGYINVDFSSKDADLIADVANLPFKNATIDRIYASHIIEHFLSGDYEKHLAGHLYQKTAKEALVEWRRVLKTNAVLEIKTPDFDKVVWMKYNFPQWMCAPAANPPFPAWCDTLISNHQHGCLFDKNVMIQLLISVGFKEKNIQFLDGCPKPYVGRENIEMHLVVVKT